MVKLDIGGGLNKKEGYLCVDKRNAPGIDYVVDIEKQRLPFDDGTIEEIYSSHTLEHIENIIFVMNEFFRVIKWDGIIKIIVPDYRCMVAFQDPTHKRFWTPESMKYFCGEYLKKYSLDYGISCCFHLDSYDETVPLGKNPEYLTELHFVLSKRKQWIEKVSYPLLTQRIFLNVNSETVVDAFYRQTIFLQQLFCKKNKQYGNNFFIDQDEKKVFWHLERNWKRIESYFDKHGSFDNISTQLENDFLIDMANYCIMILVRSELKNVK